MPGYALAGNEFKTIEHLSTYKPKHGSPPTKIREMLDAILGILCSGAPWRDWPAQHPPWPSAYHRFRYSRKHGILERGVEALLQKASKNRQVPLTLACIDDTYIRAHRHAAGARKKRAIRRRSGGRTKPRALPGRARQQDPPARRRARATVAVHAGAGQHA